MYYYTKAHLKDEADLMVYLTYDLHGTGKGVVGIAYMQSVCTSNIDEGQWKQSINEWQPTTAEFGAVSYINQIQPCFFHLKTCTNTKLLSLCLQLVAHEIGHNLGLAHDFDERHGGKGSTCNQGHHIMSYGNWTGQTKFSSCSQKDFQVHYTYIKIKSSDSHGSECVTKKCSHCTPDKEEFKFACSDLQSCDACFNYQWCMEGNNKVV